MTIIGIDISKRELVCARINGKGEEKERWKIPNTETAITKWLVSIAAHKRLLLGSESTSSYHLLVAKRCLAIHIPFKLLNPIVTKQFTKATVRGKKTDPADALTIARCLLQGEGYEITDHSFDPARILLRSAEKLADMRRAVHLMARRYEEYASEEVDAARELRATEATLQKSAEAFRSMVTERTDAATRKLLMSVPGVGRTLAPVFVAEIGTLARFRNAKALVAFAGLDPKGRQSGASLQKNTRLTKRGSPHLRRAAFLAASIAQRHDEECGAYYRKKRKEGRAYREATVANARHILARIYAVWKRGTPYEERLPLSAS